VDANDIFFIKITIDKNPGGIPPLNPVYRPLKEF
jgi:hypothetical protein